MEIKFNTINIGFNTMLILVKKLWGWMCAHKLLTIVILISTLVCLGIISYGIYWFIYCKHLSEIYVSPIEPFIEDRRGIENYPIAESTISIPSDFQVPTESVISINPDTGVESLIIPADPRLDKNFLIASMSEAGDLLIHPIRRPFSLEEVCWLKNNIDSYGGIKEGSFVYKYFHEVMETLFDGVEYIKWDRFGRPYYVVNDLVIEVFKEKFKIKADELAFILDFIDSTHYGAIQTDLNEALYTIKSNELDFELALELHGKVIKQSIFSCCVFGGMLGGLYGLFSVSKYLLEIASALNAC